MNFIGTRYYVHVTKNDNTVTYRFVEAHVSHETHYLWFGLYKMDG